MESARDFGVNGVNKASNCLIAYTPLRSGLIAWKNIVFNQCECLKADHDKTCQYLNITTNHRNLKIINFKQSFTLIIKHEKQYLDSLRNYTCTLQLHEKISYFHVCVLRAELDPEGDQPSVA